MGPIIFPGKCTKTMQVGYMLQRYRQQAKLVKVQPNQTWQNMAGEHFVRKSISCYMCVLVFTVATTVYHPLSPFQAKIRTWAAISRIKISNLTTKLKIFWLWIAKNVFTYLVMFIVFNPHKKSFFLEKSNFPSPSAGKEKVFVTVDVHKSTQKQKDGNDDAMHVASPSKRYSTFQNNDTSLYFHCFS